jgi:hypothetical protein
MTTKTIRPGSSLSLPLYAKYPRRTIPSTDVIAVTVYASKDRTVREYDLFTAEGDHLGTVSYHGKALARAAGYHRGHGCWTHRSESWQNLTEAARALLAAKESDL